MQKRNPVGIEFRSICAWDRETYGTWAWFLSEFSWGWGYPLPPITEIHKAFYAIGAFALNGEKFVGAASLNLHASPDEQNNGEPWFAGLVVHPDYWFRGIAHELHEWCRERAYIEGFPRLLASTEKPYMHGILRNRGWVMLRNNTLNEGGEPTTVYELVL